jgi:hypothetical protein
MLSKLINSLKKIFAFEIEKLFLKEKKQLLEHINKVTDYQTILISQYMIQEIKKKKDIKNLYDAEFKAFSQMGEDGIIQFLINNIEISSSRFVEFGVEDYTESNTRYLLMNNNWEGLVFDSSPANVDKINSRDYAWRHTLLAKPFYVTRDNINSIISESGFSGKIGILSIDLDGNDFWIWQAINVVDPDIVICEYNSVFGDERLVSTPYIEDFNVSKYHYSNLCFGASLRALIYLAESKGYSFVGSNSGGTNAFFVRNDKLKNISYLLDSACYVKSKSRSSRNVNGELTFVHDEHRLDLIRGCDVVNVVTMEIEKI